MPDIILKYNSLDDLKPLYDLNLSKYPVDRVVKKYGQKNWLVEMKALKARGWLEDAFIMGMKMLSICAYITSKEKDKKYIKLMLGSTYEEVMLLAEQLKQNLYELYKNKHTPVDAEVPKTIPTLTEQNVVFSTREKDDIENPYIISHSDLEKMVKCEDKGILLMDVRRPEDYLESRIKFNQIINIPEQICPPGCSVKHVEDKLPMEAAAWWSRRHSFREIIVLDWADEGQARTLSNVLKNYDHEESNVLVRLLEEGYSTFAEFYPWLLTQPIPKRDNTSSSIIDLGINISFPSFDVEQDSAIPFFSRDEKPKPTEPVGVHRPNVDRGKKAAAVKWYDEKGALLQRQVEETAAALQVAKERNAREHQLQENLSRQKDAATDENQRKIYEEKGADLLLEIEDLKNQSFSKDETIKELREELEKIKIQQNDEGKRAQDEKEAEKEEKRKMEEKLLEEEMRREREETERLQKEADLLEQQQKAERKRVEEAARKKVPERPPIPKVDRTTKPPVAVYVDTKKRDFNPVFGDVEPGLTGLKNIGNTCYMNSILQCISNNVEIAKYFCEQHHLRDLNRSHRTRGEVAEEVAALVQALWSGQFRSVACKDFKSTVGSFKSEYRTYDQQDSHEFLTFLMDWLHNDLKISWPISSTTEQSELEKVWSSYKSKNYSLIWRLFYGLQKSTVSCCHCAEQSTTYEPFSNLSLGIPDYNAVTLQDCLSLYLKEEVISGWRCPKCKVERRAAKKTELCKLPSILVIHLKRFSYLDIHSKKKTTFVDFPLESLDVSCIGKGSYQSYNLYAVSNHYGTMQGGHYTAYCKSCQAKKWYKFDDHEVVPISSSDVRTAAAYILFYSSTKITHGHS